MARGTNPDRNAPALRRTATATAAPGGYRLVPVQHSDGTWQAFLYDETGQAPERIPVSDLSRSSLASALTEGLAELIEHIS
jgi:hypothetical protein